MTPSNVMHSVTTSFLAFEVITGVIKALFHVDRKNQQSAASFGKATTPSYSIVYADVSARVGRLLGQGPGATPGASERKSCES